MLEITSSFPERVALEQSFPIVPWFCWDSGSNANPETLKTVVFQAFSSFVIESPLWLDETAPVGTIDPSASPTFQLIRWNSTVSGGNPQFLS